MKKIVTCLLLASCFIPMPAHAAKVMVVDSVGSMKYTYTKNGLVSKRVTPLETMKYTYKGSRIKKSVSQSSLDPMKITDTYTYKKGRPVKILEKEPNGKTEITFAYKKGRIVKSKYYTEYFTEGVGEDGKKYAKSGSVEHEIKYQYNKKGLLKKTSMGKDFVKFSYDKHGNETKRVFSDKSAFVTKNTYKNGRLIKKKIKFSSPGEKSQTATQIYKYKKINVPKKMVKDIKKQQKSILATKCPDEISLWIPSELVIGRGISEEGI